MVENRRIVVVLVLAFLAVPMVLLHRGSAGRTELCAQPATALRIGSTTACVHSDVPPPGVDVTDRPSTAELKARPGAGAAAYQAAADLGVPTPTEVATTATGPEVTCDGDGTSGYRVQAMYVVEAGKANRYASLLSTFRTWAAGTDDVMNRSAALTGGVRHIRYVTVPGSGGTCVADVLNVTVPAGSAASFGTLVSAIQALGYTNPARKYLMWTDATVLCGVASMYGGDTSAQSNPNNGRYAQYARVDSGCWGLGDGSTDHSVEAHELMHTLGGVQNTAPHATQAGHCWDESDTMCYADGTSHAMVQVCPVQKEFFFDCNNDDYFSTYPQPGSYLSGHWNAADSRFLIGGGDGTSGGTLGTPTVLGATIAVNNPAVPGLSTQVSVAPQLPAGRTLAKVAWTSARADCTFATPTQLQSTVTCAATASAATSVTATLVDSTGATKAVTSPLTFATGTARPVTVSLTAAGQSTSASVCTGASFPLRARIVDTTSGQPVKGLAASFTKQPSGVALATSAGTATSDGDGYGSLNQSATVVTTYAAKTTAGTVYAAASPATLTATPGKCTVALAAAKDVASPYYGDPVTVSGTLTRTVAGQQVGVAGASLSTSLTTTTGSTTKVSALGSTTTATDGTFRIAVKPTATGTLSVQLADSAGYTATSADLGTVTVLIPETDLSAAIDRNDVGYGSTLTATGHLLRVAGTSVTPAKGAVNVFVTAPGGSPVKVGSGTVKADGTYAAAFPLKVSGTLTVSYPGAAGQPAAEVVVGAVTAGTWTTHLTSAASSMTLTRAATSTTVSGTLTRTYAGATQPAPGLRISIVLTPTGSVVRSTLATATTSSAGTFSARVTPKTSGVIQALLAAMPGYVESVSDPLLISVVP
jgi:hypothetical protein